MQSTQLYIIQYGLKDNPLCQKWSNGGSNNLHTKLMSNVEDRKTK